MKRVVFLMMVVGMVGIFNSAYGQNYVDLGLSSETLWKDVNAKGYYTLDEANELFGDKMPSSLQWKELIRECKWTWEKGQSAETTGYTVTGPNGNSIFLPAAGFKAYVYYYYHFNDSDRGDSLETFGVGFFGKYWVYDDECFSFEEGKIGLYYGDGSLNCRCSSDNGEYYLYKDGSIRDRALLTYESGIYDGKGNVLYYLGEDGHHYSLEEIRLHSDRFFPQKSTGDVKCRSVRLVRVLNRPNIGWK